jgi:nucleoid-associated protein YejK
MTRNGQLDQISHTLGRIEERVGHTHDCMHRIEQTMTERLEAVEAKVSELTAFRQKGSGVVLGISFAAGFLGSKLGWLGALIGAAKGH